MALEQVIATTLPADARSVGRARALVRDLLDGLGADDLVDPAQLAVSELVTNAVVHAGTDVRLAARASRDGLRVEIGDGSPHLPVPRSWSRTAGTGRGLHLVEECVDRWDVLLGPHGKTVWFELGDVEGAVAPLAPVPPDGSAGRQPGQVEVELLDVPLLMHWAWQEHAAALLREYLLHALDEDPGVLDAHARASDALNVLLEQVPVPELPEDPDALMATAVEPAVTDPRVVLRVPTGSVGAFEVLDDLLGRAVRLAADGLFLGPPTQPEIDEMRGWLCAQVLGQAAGSALPEPWRARTDVRVPIADEAELRDRYRELAESDTPLLATDESSVIVAVTPQVVRFLGYDDAADLRGRRIVVVVPHRFHQAHIAGTTLHVTNGRDVLLDRWLTVPVVRADGTEVPVELCVVPRTLASGARVFVAAFRLDD